LELRFQPESVRMNHGRRSKTIGLVAGNVLSSYTLVAIEIKSAVDNLPDIGAYRSFVALAHSKGTLATMWVRTLPGSFANRSRLAALENCHFASIHSY
jgi:hypothetical protein